VTGPDRRDQEAAEELAALWAYLEREFPAIAQQARVALRRPGPAGQR
jgi:hypothetical protein